MNDRHHHKVHTRSYDGLFAVCCLVVAVVCFVIAGRITDR